MKFLADTLWPASSQRNRESICLRRTAHRRCDTWLWLFGLLIVFVGRTTALAQVTHHVQVTALITDADSGEWLPARVYITDTHGKSWFVESADPQGSAFPYREQWVPLAGSEELHTTVSPHPFRVQLPKGEYTLVIERGKEYLPLTRQFSVGNHSIRLQLALQRWSHLAADGWYSGETHVHRRIRELPNVMLAEDLNVAFPVTFWTIIAGKPPGLEPSPLRRQGPSPFGPRVDHGYEPIFVDPTHVLFPRNTEYEIFQIGEKRHVLGAVFILNHRSRFTDGMPPVKQIAKRAHREGALLDLDKHNWPWSMMLVPIAKIDLYELANNSMWRTRFGFRSSQVRPAEYMQVEMEGDLMTEGGWIDFGLQNYYALLNCGFFIQPTAGTASGVHPVPLGFGRVYVHIDGQFNAEKWVDGLRNGRSFVTTGPMIQVLVDGQYSGHRFKNRGPRTISVTGSIRSLRPLEDVELVVNGHVTPLDVTVKRLSTGAYQVDVQQELTLAETSWVALRCRYREGGQGVRFAHTAPWHCEIDDQLIRPRREEVDYLIRRMTDEIQRSRDLLSADALAEFEEALQTYQRIAKRSR